MDNESNDKNRFEISYEISQLRKQKKMEEAIILCRFASKEYPEDNFYYKILGDLYYQTKSYLEASDAYLEFLKTVNDKALIKNFIKFYERLKRDVSETFLKEYKNKITVEIDKKTIKEEFILDLIKILEIIPESGSTSLQRLSLDDKNFREVIDSLKELEKNNKRKLYELLFFKIINKPNISSKRIDKYIVSVLERKGLYKNAIDMIYNILKFDDDEVAVRTLFRLSRRIGDYAIAETYLKENPNTLYRTNFNIQYELVYYFKDKGDDEELLNVLNNIWNSAQGSIPISKTLYNFYLQFEMFEKLQKVQDHIENLRKKDNCLNKKSQENRQLSFKIEAEKESEQGVWLKIKNLVSEQEHNRQLIAMKDLLKGFSHELGQPITNIRYAIQLHQMKIKKNVDTKEDLEVLLNELLNQTQRVGKLLKRFSPIVSSKSIETEFVIYDRIKNIFEELDVRLKDSHIGYILKGDKEVKLYGDAIQFDQVFYNLIINSIHSIKEVNEEGMIEVDINANESFTTIIFKDNGTGIPQEIQNRVFEPFFSTKDKTKDDGGEGLGLFIVWNIVKMFKGKIVIDKEYSGGAQFRIEIKKNKEE